MLRWIWAWANRQNVSIIDNSNHAEAGHAFLSTWTPFPVKMRIIVRYQDTVISSIFLGRARQSLRTGTQYGESRSILNNHDAQKATTIRTTS